MTHRGLGRGRARVAAAVALILVAQLVAMLASAGAVASSTTTFDDGFDGPDGTFVGPGWQEPHGDLLIQGNELRNAVGVAGSSLAVRDSSPSTDQIVSAVFASTNNNSAPVLGIVLRYESPGRYYALYRSSGGVSQLRIARIANGQEVVLATAGLPNPVQNSLFRLTASATGSSLSLQLEGGPTVTASDVSSGSISSGSVGLLLGTRTPSAALRVSHRADLFHADLTTAGPPTPRLAVSLGPEPGQVTVEPGAQAETFASVVLDAAGSDEDILVRALQLELATDVGSTNPAACQAFDGVTPLSSGPNIVNPAADGTHTFTLDNPLLVARSTARTVRLRCDVPAGATPGDTMEWQLRPAALVSAEGSGTGEPAVIAITPSPDDQHRLTVQTGGSGGVDRIALEQLRPVLRPGEIGLGPDLGEQKPPLQPHPAVNFEGQSPPSGAWLTVFDGDTYGDLTVSADHLNSEINGEQCGGVAALVTFGTSGRAVVARSCDAKGTDTLRLGILDTSTGAVTPLATKNLLGKIDTYGGSNPPANCDHHQNQLDYHMYCQWILTTLTVTTNADGTVTFIATSALRGSGLKNDPSRNDPNSPATVIGSATWTGPRPANLATKGKVGLVGTATSGRQLLSLTNLEVDPA